MLSRFYSFFVIKFAGFNGNYYFICEKRGTNSQKPGLKKRL